MIYKVPSNPNHSMVLRWETATLLGNLCQCSVTLTVRKCLLIFRGNFLCFSLWPLPLILALDTAVSVFFVSSLQVFTNINKIHPEPSLLQAK